MSLSVRRIIREPVVLFLATGLLFFLIYTIASNSGSPEQKQIVVSDSQVEQMALKFAATWLRPPTEGEMRGLIDSYVRNEVYYREALAMGLEQNDQVIQNRLRQKLELLMDNVASITVPSEQMLRQYLQENEETFRTDYSISFVQVYINPENHADPEAEAKNILVSLQAGSNPEELGDRTFAGYVFESYSQNDVARQFGADFTLQLSACPLEEWYGPVFSGMGVHLIRIAEFEEGVLPDLTEIRGVVEREWMAARKKELKDASYEKLLEGYEIIISDIVALEKP